MTYPKWFYRLQEKLKEKNNDHWKSHLSLLRYHIMTQYAQLLFSCRFWSFTPVEVQNKRITNEVKSWSISGTSGNRDLSSNQCSKSKKNSFCKHTRFTKEESKIMMKLKDILHVKLHQVSTNSDSYISRAKQGRRAHACGKATWRTRVKPRRSKT